ncbi:MAG: efflux transporter outer membrane subunit [Alistipes sp.]|nr:efflux transporter outer membrane subunit [Alistipes sp.]
MKRIFVLLSLAWWAAACTPKLIPPQVEVPLAYQRADRFVQDSLQLQVCWWELFGDTTLNRLVERALANNRDLVVAVERVEEARERLRVARAEFLPSVGSEVQGGASYNRATKIEQTYAAELTLSWELSLFGSLRHTTTAARSAWAAEAWNARGVELSLVAEVATAYFTLLQYERDLYIATRTCALRRESAALIDSMFRYGMSSGIDRDQAYGLVYTAEADIPRYRSAVEQTRLSLNLLLGEVPYADSLAGNGHELLTDLQPEALAVGVPSELLQRRPDIMQAYFTVQQAAAEAGLARSNRFPSLVLSASGGIGASSLKGLSSSNPAVWSATGSLVKPIFNFGRLRSTERAAVSAYRQAAATYEQTILAAFSDVETCFSAIAANREESSRLRALVDTYQEIVRMAQALYRNGMVNYVDVMDAERTLYTSQMQLVNLVAQQYINYVSLCKALGGGWQ